MSRETTDQLALQLDAIMAGTRPCDLESETLDFKTQGRSIPDTLRDLAEAAACFANARGGRLVVGVADNVGGSDAFVGCDLDAVRTKRRIFELTDPHLSVDAEQVMFADRSMLVIHVPAGADVFQVSGRATERIGTACEPMSSMRIADVVADRRGDDWSAADSGRPVSDVDPIALAHARALRSEALGSDTRSSKIESDGDLLRTLAVVTPDGTRLNRAGELLFVGRPEITAELQYVYRRTTSGELVANERLGGPLISSLVRVMELATARVDRTPVNLPTGQQLQVADLPVPAIREAIVNAIMHRDYRRVHLVTIEHAPTRFNVTSPGPFVSGITADNVLTAPSHPRNASLAGAIRLLGLAESAGTGVDRMYTEMARIGHRTPEWSATPDDVGVTLLGGAPNAYVTRYVATLPPEEADSADTLLILLTLLSQRTVTSAGLRPVLQKPEHEVSMILRRLAASPVHMLEATRWSAPRSNPTYRLREDVVAALAPALPYHRRTSDEIDRKIVGLVNETGEVNARMVKLLLDVDAGSTSRVLTDLVKRKVLVKTSEAQRGTTVTYGPGPEFPKQPRRRRKAIKEQK